MKKVDLVPHENPNGKFTNQMELITKEFGITKNVPKDSKVQLSSITTKSITTQSSTPSTMTSVSESQIMPKPQQTQDLSNLIENEKENDLLIEDINSNTFLNSSEEEPLKKEEDEKEKEKAKIDKTE